MATYKDATKMYKSEVTEFQRANSIIAYEKCNKTMNTGDLGKAIYNKVHGIEGISVSVSQLKLILSGKDKNYDHLWRSEEVTTADPINNFII